MKRPFHQFLAVASLVAGLCAVVRLGAAERTAVVLQGNESPEQIQQAYTTAIQALVPELGFGPGRQTSLRRLEATVHHAARPGAEVERLACARAIAAALQGDAPAHAKFWLLQAVQFVGRAEVVPAEAGLLRDPDPTVREAARCALQHNPALEAAEALRAALRQATDPAWQAALALALGTRADAASVPLLVPLLQQPDPALVSAVLAALGNIGGSQAEAALAKAIKTVPESLRIAAVDAYLKCLDRGAQAGQTAAALDACRRLADQPGLPRPARLAALTGLLKYSGEAAAERVLEMIAGADADARAVALNFVPELGRAALKRLAAGLDQQPISTQALLLGMLADRGEKAALPVALRLAKQPDEATRRAGVSALGALGDASTVPVLVELLAAGGTIASTARDSLVRLNAPGVNQAVSSALRAQSAPALQATLVEVLESRNAAEAVPVLLELVAGEAPEPRRAAMRALGKLAQPEHLPAMARGLWRASSDSDREQAQAALAQVCARVQPPAHPSEPALALYQQANPDQRRLLLPVLGRLGGTNAFAVIRAALASTDAALVEAAIAALAFWPESDEAVEAQLVSLAQDADKPDERVAAVRAYIRIVTQPSGLSDLEKLKKLQRAMSLAERNDERNLVLAHAGELRHIETIRFLTAQLQQPALVTRAGHSLCDLARDQGFRNRYRAEFESAFNQVLAVAKDPALIDRAKRRLAELSGSR
jgi:HEAT repeat protein